MMREGWNRHPYLSKFISAEYPIFSINDFKSTDGLFITKKTEDDLMKDTFKEIYEYYNTNKALVNAFAKFKKFISKLNVDFMKYSFFDELINAMRNDIMNMSLDQSSKATLQFELVNMMFDIHSELENTNIEKPTHFLSDKFKYFLMLIG